MNNEVGRDFDYEVLPCGNGREFVRIAIDFTTVQKWMATVEKGIGAKVTFTGDMAQMTKEANHIQLRSLEELHAELLRVLPEYLRIGPQCPKCVERVEDFDGFGVLAHDKCGYCSHPSRYGGVCGICGDVEQEASSDVQSEDMANRPERTE